MSCSARWLHTIWYWRSCVAPSATRATPPPGSRAKLRRRRGARRAALCLLAGLLLLARADEKRVADVPTVPPGEGPVLDDLGVHHDLDVHVEERDDLEVLELVVSDPA